MDEVSAEHTGHYTAGMFDDTLAAAPPLLPTFKRR
jgi:hypothetical protein